MAKKQIIEKKENGNGGGNVLILLFDFNKSTCMFSSDEAIWCFLCNYLSLSLSRFCANTKDPTRTAAWQGRLILYRSQLNCIATSLEPIGRSQILRI